MGTRIYNELPCGCLVSEDCGGGIIPCCYEPEDSTPLHEKCMELYKDDKTPKEIETIIWGGGVRTKPQILILVGGRRSGKTTTILRCLKDSGYKQEDVLVIAPILPMGRKYIEEGFKTTSPGARRSLYGVSKKGIIAFDDVDIMAKRTDLEEYWSRIAPPWVDELIFSCGYDYLGHLLDFCSKINCDINIRVCNYKGRN